MHCDVAAVCTEVGLQEAATEVMAGGVEGGVNVMVAVADVDVSVLLVAVRVTVVVALTADGAV